MDDAPPPMSERTNPIADTLRAAKALIDTPEKWTKGAYARTKKGRKIDGLSPQAVCWCAYGAINKVVGGDFATINEASNYLRIVADGSIMDWNDAPERTHAEVMAAFDRAIAATEASL